jgi:hypothetical protein
MSKPRKSRIGYRDAGTGKFITEKQFERRSPNTVVREHVPLPGKGTAK